MISVLIVNKSRLICGVISTMLKDEEDIHVIGWATDMNEAYALIESRKPDIVLISTNLPNNGALILTQNIDIATGPKVLIMGVTELEEVILRYIEAGAAGYVLRADSADDLILHIRAVYNGEALISPEISAALMARLTELADAKSNVEIGPEGFADLTPRERQVLELISKGLNNQEIAQHLVIEVGTVKNHVHNILEKLDVNSRYDAADYWEAIQNDIDSELPTV